MKTIKCCTHCVPPKRHKNCHDSCKEYKEERAELDKENKIIREAKNKNLIFQYVHDKEIKLRRYNEKKSK